MYVSMTDILQDAHKNNYAVMAVNSINMEMARAVISAAEEERSPIIVNIGMGQMKKHAHANVMVPLIKKLAEEAKVPVALNHDHGQDLDFIIKCIQDGFSSVMIDASSFPFEENVHRTSTIVKLAHPHNICVEAELGHVGQADASDNDKDDLYTTVKEANQYIDDTGVDALAIAIGTAHGAYKQKPKLDLQRLQDIRKSTDVPLVLHGGSGLSDDDFKNAIKYGIAKVNIFTDMCVAGANAAYEYLKANEGCVQMSAYLEARNKKVEAIKNVTMEKMRLFGSVNKA